MSIAKIEWFLQGVEFPGVIHVETQWKPIKRNKVAMYILLASEERHIMEKDNMTLVARVTEYSMSAEGLCEVMDLFFGDKNTTEYEATIKYTELVKNMQKCIRRASKTYLTSAEASKRCTLTLKY